MRNIYKYGKRNMDRRYKTKRTFETRGFTKQNNSKRYRTLCHYIEETQSLYKPNVQKQPI